MGRTTRYLEEVATKTLTSTPSHRLMHLTKSEDPKLARRASFNGLVFPTLVRATIRATQPKALGTPHRLPTDLEHLPRPLFLNPKWRPPSIYAPLSACYNHTRAIPFSTAHNNETFIIW